MPELIDIIRTLPQEMSPVEAMVNAINNISSHMEGYKMSITRGVRWSNYPISFRVHAILTYTDGINPRIDAIKNGIITLDNQIQGEIARIEGRQNRFAATRVIYNQHGGI